MRVGSLFTGIGGIDLGLERAGHRIVFQCESDPYRRRILKRHWPGVPIYEDVRRVLGGSGRQGGERGLGGRNGADPESSGVGYQPSPGDIDLLCGGFPCQDLSVAGKRAGLSGERSGLFFEFARIADAIRPEWLLIENVPGLLSSNGGRDFGELLGTLADLGYGVGWRILDSRYFGVPQRRRRVFILGNSLGGSAGAERCGEVLSIGQGCERHPAKGRKARAGAAANAGSSPAEPGGGGVNRALTTSNERLDADTESFVVSHTLTSEGFATEDGTGRGTPLTVSGPVVASELPAPCGCPWHYVRDTRPGRCMCCEAEVEPDPDRLITPGNFHRLYECRERERESVNALDQMKGGPDDNSAQAGHLIVEP